MDGHKVAKRAGIGIAAVFGLAAAMAGGILADINATDTQTITVAGGYYAGGRQRMVLAMDEKTGQIESLDNLSTAATLPTGRYHADIGCRGEKALGLAANRCIVRAVRFE
jgi:hypothetical protein